VTSFEAAFAALVVAVAATVAVGLGIAAARTGRSQRRLTLVAGSALGAWLAFTALLAATGSLMPREGRPPLVLGLVFTCVVVGVLGSRSRVGRMTIAAVPPWWIIGLQAFRLPVELFLWRLSLAGLVPQRMTFEGRNFDVAVGITAPVVAWLAASGRIGRRGQGVWHLASLGMVLNVATTAILSVPGPLWRFRDDVPLTIVGRPPWVWLPALLVPLAVSSHVVSLARLRR
jgi:hypothetical protein